jgi:hypothetical protein
MQPWVQCKLHPTLLSSINSAGCIAFDFFAILYEVYMISVWLPITQDHAHLLFL